MAGTVNKATTSAVPGWLTVDSTAAQAGYHTAQYGYPATPVPPVPVVPTANNPIPADNPQYVTDSPGYQYDSEGVGAWPSLPSVNAWDEPLQRPTGPAQGVTETLLPSESGAYSHPGAWAYTESMETYDATTQSTNTEGWFQNIPYIRTSHRNQWGQHNPENNPTWYPYSERPVRGRPAVTATGFTPDVAQFGTPGFVNGSLPVWSMTGGQGNTAYQTPGPPASNSNSQQQPTVADPTAGWA